MADRALGPEMTRGGSLVRSVLLFAGLVFLVGPVALVVLIGLDRTGNIDFPVVSPTFERIGDLLGDPEWAGAVVRSCVIAAAATMAALTIATLAASASVRGPRVVSSLLRILVVTPAVVPVVVYALGLVLFQQTVDFDPRLLVTVAHTVLALPLAFVVMRVGVLSLRPELVDAARLLGAGRWLVVSRVVAPQLAPFALVAAAVAASISFAEPIVAIFLVNDGLPTLPQRSFEGLRFGFDPLIFTAATLLIAVTLTVATVAGLAWLVARRRGLALLPAGPEEVSG